ncbi:DUF4259 domain-containing protein [Curtobacterium sp. ER1/6]|uniref:DUF4259 domain-containing protein n=1 Tax=Curtobacterium sp. ER1/6 TaxID=1891920 RepID=UPI00084F99ED|nr:DUF4259 domain-containing protein [Curtobacterium sp. ER1/6]
MGTWSAEPIGNDAAADFVAELDGERRWTVVKAAFSTAAKLGDTLDSDTAATAIAAAEVVAHGLARPTQTDAYTERIQQFVGRADVLAPQAELSNFLDSGPERYATDLPGAFSVKLRYEDRAGTELTDEYKLDFTAGRGDLRPEIHGLHHIAKTLRAIAKKQGITHF